MVRFRPSDWLDHVFEIGIVLKGIDGIPGVVGGVLLLLVARAEISGLVHALTQHELSQDPRDLIASRLLHTANSLTRPGQLFGAAYLLVQGIVEVVLVGALLRNKLWAYPWLIGVLLTFIGYQVYRIVLSPTLGLIALTGFDVVIVALMWREYQCQRVYHRRLLQHRAQRLPSWTTRWLSPLTARTIERPSRGPTICVDQTPSD
jgi:uncharacterized membrane protein